MKKVLFVITKDDVGGAQRYVRDLADNLDKTQLEVKIITGGKNGIHFLSNSFKPYFLFINDLAAVIELFLIFRREQPNIIHLNSSKAGVVGALAGWLYKLLKPKGYNPKAKIVFTAHGWIFNPDNNLGWFGRHFCILLHRLAGKFQDVIINVSEYDRKLAIKQKIALVEKLFTVHNGVDYENMNFVDKQIARKILIEKLKIKNWKLEIDGIWVGSMGRLVSEKSYSDFIVAAALVKNPNVKFFIAGEGYEREKLEFKIKQLGLGEKFFLLGHLGLAEGFLKAFDIFAMSSVKEGFPYALLEAMAAGLPIITTRVGGMPEAIEGRGLVMPPRAPEELARAIDHYLDRPQEAGRLAAEAKKYLEANFTLKRMVEETEKVYASR